MTSSLSATPGRRRSRSKARLADWLAPRGLAFNEDKTRVVSLAEGFDFLGFNVRRYRGKLLIKPSKAAVRRIRERLRDRAALPPREQRSRGDQTAQPDHPGMGQLLPDTRSRPRSSPISTTTCGGSPTSGPGSATRTNRRPGCSPGTSASSTRPGKTGGCSATAKAAPTCTASPGPASSDTRSSSSGASPDDPALADYWAGRRRKPVLPINNTSLRLLKAQDGCCPICKTPLFADQQPQTPSDWEHG